MSDTQSNPEFTQSSEGSRHASPASYRPSGWARAVERAVLLGGVLLLLGIVSFVGLAVWGAKTAMEAPQRVVAGTVDAVGQFLTALHSRTLTARFMTYATRIEGTNRYQFAQVSTYVLHVKEDCRRFMSIPLGEVVYEARYPVTFTYYVDLSEPWDFQLEGDTLRVTAPPIRWNEPAIDVARLEIREVASSLMRQEQPVREQLKRELAGRARVEARRQADQVRDKGRLQIAQFVRQWLLTMPGVLGQGQASPVRHVEVVFADEQPPLARKDGNDDAHH